MRAPPRPPAAHRASRRLPAGGEGSRAAIVESIVAEITAWRDVNLPDPTVPLEAEDVARLAGDCFAALGIDDGVAADLSVNTVHYYRRKEVIDPPIGRTSAARYATSHLWQAAASRLAGQLGLVTLDEARRAIRGRDEQTLIEYLAARVADARARAAARGAPGVRPLAAHPLSLADAGAHAAPSAIAPNAVQLALPHGASCLLAADHPALRSRRDARAVVRALALALDAGRPDFDQTGD